MTILHTHCPNCGNPVTPMAVSDDLIRCSLTAAFYTIRKAPAEDLRTEIIGSHGALLIALLGYCEGCADEHSHTIPIPADPQDN